MNSSSKACRGQQIPTTESSRFEDYITIKYENLLRPSYLLQELDSYSMTVERITKTHKLLSQLVNIFLIYLLPGPQLLSPLLHLLAVLLVQLLQLLGLVFNQKVAFLILGKKKKKKSKQRINVLD